MSEKPSTAPKVTDDLRAVATELAPCPFCGSAPEWYEAASDRAFSLDCSNNDCGAELRIRATRDEAIAAWNRRALLARPVDEPQHGATRNGADVRHVQSCPTLNNPHYCDDLHAVPSASSPTNERVERLLDLLERAHDVIHRVGEESVKTHNAITEELSHSTHKGEV